MEKASVVKYSNNSSIVLPKLEVEMVLSDKLFKFERARYNLLMLAGDLGGFNSAITLIPGFILSFYTPAILQKSIASKTAAQLKGRKKKRNYIDM